MLTTPITKTALKIPADHLLWGNAKPFSKDILGFLTHVGQQSSFTQFRILKVPVYLVTEPELVHDVLTDKNQSYVRNRRFAKRLNRLFGKGLLTTEGEDWKRLRKLSAPAFQPKSTNSYIPIIEDEISHLNQRWHNRSNVDIFAEMSAVTARIITRCIFGLELESDDAEMDDIMSQLMDAVMQRLRVPVYTPDWFPVKGNHAYRRAVKRLDGFIYQHIGSQLNSKSSDYPSLLSDLMAASQQTHNSRQLRDQIATLFLAGHETTATTLSFAFILLSQHPEQYKLLKQEVRNNSLENFKNLNDISSRLPITLQVIKETLRLYPAGFVFGRSVTKDTHLGEEPLTKDSLILISPYVSHRNANIFPQPEKFQPQRWDDHQPSRSEYFPFSAGPRTCIGEYLAMLEACLILANVVKNFDVECGTDALKIKPSITLRAMNNTQAKIKPVAKNSSASSSLGANREATTGLE